MSKAKIIGKITLTENNYHLEVKEISKLLNNKWFNEEAKEHYRNKLFTVKGDPIKLTRLLEDIKRELSILKKKTKGPSGFNTMSDKLSGLKLS